MKELVGLVDCNNFFVSCERLFRPDLAKRPVVVLSSNDGCVVARSQEVKDKGIPMGVPYFQVKDTLSDMDAAIFSSNFTLYRDISARVFTVVGREIGRIEQYSIDECFFLVEPGKEVEVANRVREIVAREIGIPVSVGVGLSRTQAKFAASFAKRMQGVCVFGNHLTEDEITKAKLTEIWGVGSGRSRAFSKKGLVTVGDFLKLDTRTTHSWFGVEGVRLRSELRGDRETTLTMSREPAKSHTSSRSFAQSCTDKESIRRALLGHLEEVLKKLHTEELTASAMRIFFQPGRHSDYVLHGVFVEMVFTIPTNDIFTLTALVADVVEKYFEPGIPYKKAGITLSTTAKMNLEKPLFAQPSSRTEELSTVIFNLNGRFGRQLVRVGLPKDPAQAPWVASRKVASPRYTTEWSSLRLVKAKDFCS